MEALRDQRGLSWLGDLVGDVRLGCRMLAKNPGFATVAVLMIALGVGANTAVFTVADALLLRPPPFADSERLYWIYDINDRLRLTVNDAVGPSPGNFIDWRGQNRSFDYMVAWRNWWFSVAGASDSGVAEQVRGVNVSPAFFDMLGVRATIGRTFRPDEEEPGRDQVVVLTEGFWQRHFGRDPNVVGKTVMIDGRPFSIIGVLPEDFYFLWPDSAMFMPMTVDDDFRAHRSTHSIVVLARLAPGVTPAGARSEMDRLARDLSRAYPGTNEDWGAALQPVFPLNKELRPVLRVLLAAVGLVLLIACINVASLLLVRANVRQREMAVRTAIGATRGRLMRQMFAETALLAGIGSLGGLLVASGGLRILVPLIPEVQIARTLTIAIDTRVLLFTAGTAFVTAMATGLWPALQASRTDGLRVSAQSGRATAGRALLTVEIALSVMLLIGATLLVRSFWNLQQIDPGFRPQNVLTMQLWLPEGKYNNPSSVSAFYQEVLRRLHQFPEVSAAALVNTRPFLGWSLGATVAIPGRPDPVSGDEPIVGCRIISPGYLAALGTPLIRGRGFADSDGPATAAVALVNQVMARRFWPSDDPIGQSLRVRSLGSSSAAPWWPDQMTDTFTIVGVVGDIKESRLSNQIEPVVYLSYLQSPSRYTHLLVRTETSTPANVTQVVQREIRAVDPDLGLYDTRTMEAVLGQAVAAPRLSSLLLWAFATVALLLSAVGVYGVTSYAVTRRTREFAIRMAIGAEARSLSRMVARQGLVIALAGISIGLVGALLLARTLAGLLYGVAATDVATLIGSAGVVLVVALVACWRPAWRATRVDPVSVLRTE